MSHDVLTLRPTDTVGAAWLQLAERKVHQSPVLCPTKVRRIARVMLATGLSAVPIVDDGGQLLGIVSRSLGGRN
jgi:CBS domain-containing protein